MTVVALPHSGVDRFHQVALAEDLPPGAVLGVAISGYRIALMNHAGSILAVDGDCGHAAGPLGEGTLSPDCVLTCPWHGAQYDPRSGVVIRGPARKSLRTHAVKVSDGVISVALV